ncbi:MAG TPA: hypothetical protein DEQ14_10950 [Treponema sp.]|nr:hypothetical protein [Treponema sp.]
MGYWANSGWNLSDVRNGRLCVPYQHNGQANSGFGRRGQLWNLSDPYKSVAFGIRADIGDQNAIGCTYTFTLESGVVNQYSVEFKIDNAMDKNWVELLFSLDDFVDAGGEPMPAAVRENITGWRFNLKTGNDIVTNPIIWIDSVLAKLIVPNSGQAGITIDPEADFAGFPENITLYKYGGGESAELEISLAAYAAAKWYVDGTEVGTAGAYTLKAADWSVGTHSLTMEVTVGGARYSKTVDFVVAR